MTAQYYIIKRKLWRQSSIRSIILQSITVWLADVPVNEWKVHPHGSILTPPFHAPYATFPPISHPIKEPSATLTAQRHIRKQSHDSEPKYTINSESGGATEQNKIDNDEWSIYGSIRRSIGCVYRVVNMDVSRWQICPWTEWHDGWWVDFE